MTFKGGTSLSKGFGIIERFSEDIDLAISHSFFGIEKTGKSQREKLRKMARVYILEILSAQLDAQLKEMGVSGYTIENVSQVQDKDEKWRPIDSDKDPTVILLHYPSILEDTINYIPPRVKIEISCLSMDEPTELRPIRSLIGESFDDEDTNAESFVRTVVPTRTFLEKLFLLAEEFQKEKPRSVRISRHLYDLEKLMDTEYGEEALSNRTLYDAIVEHRKAYYASEMATFDRFLAVVGFFRSSGYFKLRKELGDISEIKILVGININDIFRKHNKALETKETEYKEDINILNSIINTAHRWYPDFAYLLRLARLAK